MRFTVLGKSPAWQDAGGACSSYLAVEDGFTLLIDCGNGAFAKLRERVDYADVDAVLISHVHADHFLDLVPFSYALTLATPGGGARRPPLHLPPGGADQLRALVSIWGSEGLIDAAFEPREYAVGAELRLGPLEVRLHEVPHFAVTHAVELVSPSGARLVYGSDCRFSDELVRAAEGAAVLLAEATLAEPNDAPLTERGHMSAVEAGEAAARAGVGRLVLTHISDQLDQEAALAAAARSFTGPVEVAATGSSWEL